VLIRSLAKEVKAIYLPSPLIAGPKLKKLPEEEELAALLTKVT